MKDPEKALALLEDCAEWVGKGPLVQVWRFPELLAFQFLG
jgi:hypothetical protein